MNIPRFCCRHNTRNSMETMQNIRRKVTNILIYYATNQVFMACPEGCKLTPPTGPKAAGVPAQAHPFIRAEYLAHLCSHLRHTHTHTCNHISHRHTLSLITGLWRDLWGGSPNGSSTREAAALSLPRPWCHAHQSRRLVILADRWSVCKSVCVCVRESDRAR